MGHAKKLEIHDHGRGQRPTGFPTEQLERPPIVAPEKTVGVEDEPNPPPPAPPGLGPK